MIVYNADPRIMWANDLFLRKPCRILSKEEVLSDGFRSIVQLLFESLYEMPSGIGLAAPQIGLQVQLAVIDIKRDGKSPIVLINPEYIPISEDLADSTETCLSFQNYAGNVARYASVLVRAKNLRFEDVEFQATGFKAFACQHEIDQGIVRRILSVPEQLALLASVKPENCAEQRGLSGSVRPKQRNTRFRETDRHIAQHCFLSERFPDCVQFQHELTSFR